MSDPNSIFDSCFPLVEVQKSATMSGSEMMARVGLRENGKRGPGRTGRPRKPKAEIISHPDDPALTAVDIPDEDDPHPNRHKLRKGSTLQIRLADGTLKSIVLYHDTYVGLIATRDSED